MKLQDIDKNFKQEEAVLEKENQTFQIPVIGMSSSLRNLSFHSQGLQLIG